MPTYDYRCKGCGHEFEHYQSIKADALANCPECKQDQLERLIGTGAALLFKGSGFYLTDYRSDSYRSAAKKDSGGAASSGGEKSGGTAASPAPASGGTAGGSSSGSSSGGNSSGGSTTGGGSSSGPAGK